MSVISKKDKPSSTVDVEAIKAELRTEFTQELTTLRAAVDTAKEEAAESILTDIRNNLTAAPVDGEQWDVKKSYIVGDTVIYDGVSYTAVRYSRGKTPADNADKWKPTPTEETIQKWSDIEDGTVITAGTQVTYNGYTWVCETQHFKSTVYKPTLTSSKWKRVEQ